MSFGAQYSGIYDALYGSKDYPGEVDFALKQLRDVVGDSSLEILDLGCGTGIHAVELVKANHRVIGVDLSPDMVEFAQRRKAGLPPEIGQMLEFQVGDVRTFRTKRQFDAVVSLFHVFGYMTSDADVSGMLKTAREQVRAGGAFLFDFWHAPSVLAGSPPPRPRVFVDGSRRISRDATLYWDHERSLVKVQYDIHVEDSETGQVIDTHEDHLIRYFDVDDLSRRLANSDFEVIRFGEWLTGKAPSDNSFGVFALCKAL